MNRRAACAILEVTREKFKLLIGTGVVPAGLGLGPRSLTWDRDGADRDPRWKARSRSSAAAACIGRLI